MHSPDGKTDPSPADIVSLNYANPGERTDKPVAVESLAAKLGIRPRLSDPIPLDAIVPDTPYLIVDHLGRILIPNGVSSQDWQWAFLGHYNEYPGNITGVSFSTDPSLGPAVLTLGPPLATQYLHARGSATSWEYVFFGASQWNSSYPVIRATAVSDGSGSFHLKYMNGTTQMALCAQAGSWNWAFIGNTTSYTPQIFTLHKFFLSIDDLITLCRKTWPSANIDIQAYRFGDPDYELLDSSKATQIFNASQLADFKYTEPVFDCEDFAYVYKAQASKEAYYQYTSNNHVPSRAFACGVIWGKSKNNRVHAANVFVSFSGNVCVLEPQNGNMVMGEFWVDSYGDPYQPYFIGF